MEAVASVKPVLWMGDSPSRIRQLPAAGVEKVHRARGADPSGRSEAVESDTASKFRPDAREAEPVFAGYAGKYADSRRAGSGATGSGWTARGLAFDKHGERLLRPRFCSVPGFPRTRYS